MKLYSETEKAFSVNIIQKTKILKHRAGMLNLYICCHWNEKEPNLIRLKEKLEKIKQIVLEIETMYKI